MIRRLPMRARPDVAVDPDFANGIAESPPSRRPIVDDPATAISFHAQNEIVLREGTPSDVLTYIDVALLVGSVG